MSCEVASLPFQAHANYRTCLIDFVFYGQSKRERTKTLTYNSDIIGQTNNLYLINHGLQSVKIIMNFYSDHNILESKKI